MKGQFRSASTMRPKHCWTVLQVSILAVLLLSMDADSQDCFPAIKVRRNTVYNATVGQLLKINCSVVFCNNSPPEISWGKFQQTLISIPSSSTPHIKTEWENKTNSKGISYLVFENILRNDTGVYRCRGGLDVSHFINVSVSGDVELSTVTWKNDTDSTQSPGTDLATLWPYVYPAAGIMALVIIIIIISVVSMRGCRGKSRKEKETENQYMAIPMFEQPSTLPSLQPPTRGSPISQQSLPSRGAEHIYAHSQRPAQTCTPSLEANQTAASGHNEPVYNQKKKGEKRKRKNAEQEGESPVVYAALNHQMPPEAFPRPQRPTEESSEYAAIRVS